MSTIVRLLSCLLVLVCPFGEADDAVAKYREYESPDKNLSRCVLLSIPVFHYFDFEKKMFKLGFLGKGTLSLCECV